MAREASFALTLVAVLATVGAGSALAGAAPIKHYFYSQSYLASHPELQPPRGYAGSDLTWHGGAVQHAPKVYLIFWGFLGQDPAGVAPYATSFFAGIGGTSWTNIQTQYTDAAGAITNPSGQLKGTWYDDSLNPPPALGQYISNEALKAEAHFGYDADANYMVFGPHLLNDPEFAVVYCAWHSSVLDSRGRAVAYTYMPYIPDADTFQVTSCGDHFVNHGAAGNLDGVSIAGGHEYAEAVTDPHPSSGWVDPSGQENGDKCAWLNTGPGKMQNLHLTTGTFAVQGLWSNAAHSCVIGYP